LIRPPRTAYDANSDANTLAPSGVRGKAFLRKVPVVHYVDEGGKRVPKGTPGASRVVTESKKWYVCYRANGKQKQVPAYRDKQSSLAKLNKVVRSLERGDAGLTDPFKEHLDRAAVEHLEEYLPVLRERVSDGKYFSETERILRTVLADCGVATLRDLTADRVENYLTAKKAAPNTRKKHHSAVSGFAKWLFKRKRIERNFLLTVDVPTGGVVTELRSLDADELQRLLDAARARPLREALTIRRGARKGQLLARIRPQVRASLESEGRQRALLYKTAMLTGLRRGELAQLRVGFIDFAHKPYPLLELPGSVTKNKRGAKLLLLPGLAEELQQWVQNTGKEAADLLFDVPEKVNLIFLRDLKAAGIPVEDGKGGVAKFRSLRKSANVLLARAKVPLKIRQLFMRHGDVRLTAHTYDDSTLEEMAGSVMPAFEQVGLR
jgi:integrase